MYFSQLYVFFCWEERKKFHIKKIFFIYSENIVYEDNLVFKIPTLTGTWKRLKEQWLKCVCYSHNISAIIKTRITVQINQYIIRNHLRNSDGNLGLTSSFVGYLVVEVVMYFFLIPIIGVQVQVKSWDFEYWFSSQMDSSHSEDRYSIICLILICP